MSERTDRLIEELINAAMDNLSAHELEFHVEDADRRLDKARDFLRAELAASQAEVERLRGIIREAIGYCSGSRVAHIGEFKAYVPQIDVEAVKRWRETVEGGAQ